MFNSDEFFQFFFVGFSVNFAYSDLLCLLCILLGLRFFYFLFFKVWVCLVDLLLFDLMVAEMRDLGCRVFLVVQYNS